MTRRDRFVAVIVGALALAVYLRTLAPGMVFTADTPMFQFIGRVLGVAHPPGYPLYVFLTFPFSFLPIGALPYRINLFSAVAAAAAVAFVYATARRLGCRPAPAAAAALGLAFGGTFWSQSVIAEVYTLNAALVAAMFYLLLTWGATGRAVFFFSAVAVFAAGLGLHTTIVGFAPAMLVYAALTDRRFVLRPRTILVSLLILCAGLLQYGYILVRSHHAAAYVESRATTVSALVDVVLARRFGFALFGDDWRTVLLGRVPELVNGVLRLDLTAAGLLLSVAGIAALLRRRPAQGWLLALSFAAIFGFVANYSADDLPVFLIPGILVLWLGVAVAGEQLARLAPSGAPSRVAAGLVLLLPLWNLQADFQGNDRSRDFEAAAAFDSLFAALPDRSALLREDFLTDRMVHLKLLGEQAGGDRSIAFIDASPERVRARRDEGFRVFGFAGSAQLLRQAGFDVAYAPLPALDVPLPQFLARLPDGALVALAVPAGLRQAFEAAGAASLDAIGAGQGLVPEARANAIVGIRGARRGAIRQGVLLDARIALAPGDPVGATSAATPVALEVVAGEHEATVRQGGRDVVRSTAGAVLCVWNRDGTRASAFVLEPAHGFVVPRPVPSPASVYEVGGFRPAAALPQGEWIEVSPLARSGSLMLQIPATAEAVLYLADDEPLAPSPIEVASTGVSLSVTHLGRGSEDRAMWLTRDGFSEARLADAAFVARVEVSRVQPDPAAILLTAGGVPRLAFARLSDSQAVRGTISSVETVGLLRTPDRLSEVLLMHRDEQTQLFGAGWSGTDTDGVMPFRVMTDAAARTLLPLQGRRPAFIRIQAFWQDEGDAPHLAIEANARKLARQRLAAGWHAYEWALPPGTLRPGVNEVTLVLDSASAATGGARALPRVAIAEVRVIHAAL